MEKKVVGRNVLIALGIICIILIAGLGGAMAYYTRIINDKNTTYDSYALNHTYTNSEYDNYVGNHSHIDSEYNSYVNTHHHTDSEYDSLQNQANDLNHIINLEKSTVWVDDQTISQPASSYTHWTPTFSASYAGYVSVWVQTSTTTNTYVRVIYTAYGVNFDQQIGVGTGGTVVFPLLPCLSIEIRVGNSNLFSGATETVTITYHY